jgi:Uma2 family endonuclease
MGANLMQTVSHLYRWTRAEYERLAELGLLEGKRVELVEGQIVTMAAKGPVHRVVVNRARRALDQAFPIARYAVWIEQPIALTAWDEPEPDVVVTVGRDEDYLSAHPTPEQTVLVVEVAVTSLNDDLHTKADRYAAAAIADYWVLDASAQRVIVLREPRPDAASATGSRYSERREYGPGEQILPLAAGALPVNVADLLP